MRTTNKPNAAGTSSARINSLDEFRGYTIVGMIVVNFLGGYACCPAILKHWNTYCSYADSIMPHFFFAVGMSLHLVAVRSAAKRESDSKSHTRRRLYRKTIRRSLILMGLAALLYFPWFGKDLYQQWTQMSFWFAFIKRDWFQTLTHIAVTSVWVLPVLFAGNRVRIGWLVMSTAVHIALSQVFYFHWLYEKPTAIDGGPLGFLTWSIPVIFGMITASWIQPWKSDAVFSTKGTSNDGISPNTTEITEHSFAPNQSIQSQISLWRWGTIALGTMLLGYGMSCGTRLYDSEDNRDPENSKLALQPVISWNRPKSETTPNVSRGVEEQRWSRWLAEPPGIAPPAPEVRAWNYWMMSQRAGTASYQVFAAGLSLLVFTLFYYLSDVRGYSIGCFRTFGTNALMCYVVHGMVIEWTGSFLTKESAWGWVLLGLLSSMVLIYGIIRGMEHRGIRIVAR